MKTADLKPGVLYNVSPLGSPGFILDIERHYSRRGGDYYHLTYGGLIEPNFSGKGTHVLGLVYSSSRPTDAATKAAAEYFLSDYRAGKDAPKGWRVVLLAPVSVRSTYAEYLSETDRNIERRRRAQSAWTAMAGETQASADRLSALGVTGTIQQRVAMGEGSIVLTLTQVEQIAEMLERT